MHVRPTPQKYLHWKATAKRAPVWGEEYFPQLSPALLYQLLFSGSDNSFLFESNNGPLATARYSLMGESNTKMIQTQPGRSNDTEGLSVLQQLNFDCLLVDDEIPSHFWGGWVGYIGYDAAGMFEKFQHRIKEGLQIPDTCFMQVERLAVYDHESGLLRYILSPETMTSDYDSLVKEIHETWNRIHSAGTRLSSQGTISYPVSNKERSRVKSSTSKTDYMAMVEKAKAYIAAGDIYQANLSQRFEMDFSGDPFDLYRRLRELNPSPFAGFLKIKDFALVSSSPERLVKLEGNRLETRPIAGTRPRGKTPDEDRLIGQELLLNEKEKAEHLMLVDLERNDLGRICTFGSVHVSELMFLEKYSHVNHIVSNISGTLAAGVTVSDILQAVFPGGTITGCPKIRCMEIIDELEPVSRGPYSGSFGYIGWSPVMDLNIIIRTIVVKNQKASFHVGAGIVADSDPESEYNETLAKAAAMLEVLCHEEVG